MIALGLEHSYARDLPGASVAWKPAPVPAPRLLFLNEPLAEELGLDPATLRGAAALFAGNLPPTDAEPVAQAYAGHQFGGFSPQLGDGRALLLGERIDRAGRRRDIAFKGSGRTPFSRGGDGKAAVGPMLREVLIGEAMHALGVPTTRALAVAATGEHVYRDDALPGAVLTRVASSHLRVGTFQYFAARGDREGLRRLLDYTIARHDPALREAPEPWLALLEAVARRQAALVARWMNLGFIHGVMNTDNMALSGESIDYGPCAFMEAYDPATVFSSIDRGGRYAFGNQPHIARWNLARFAEALLTGVVDDEREDEAAVKRAVARAMTVIDAFPAAYETEWRRGQRAKLGLDGHVPLADAAALADDWLALLQAQRVDFTRAWRHLADAAGADPHPLRALFEDPAPLDDWLDRWKARRPAGPAALRAVNPRVIPRNHLVEAALSAASDADDLRPFERLLAAVQRPFDDHPALAAYAEPAPAAVTACYRTFCGT